MSYLTTVRNTTTVSLEVVTTEGSFTIPPRATIELRGEIVTVPKGVAVLGTVSTSLISTPLTDQEKPTFNQAVKFLPSGLILTSSELKDPVSDEDSGLIEFDGNKVYVVNSTGSRKILQFQGDEASLVANGLYSTGSYTDPSWIVSLAAAKISGILPVINGGVGLDLSLAQAGELLIGNGSGVSIGSLTNGGNESITITYDAGNIVIDTDQDIRTTATPMFAGVNTDSLSSSSATADIYNETVATINVGGEATAVNIGAATSEVTIKDNITVKGNLTVEGTQYVTVASTSTDETLTVGGASPPASDNSKDRGILFRWHNGVSAKLGFFGFDRSNQTLSYIPDVTNTSGVMSGTLGTFKGSFEGDLTGNASTASTWETPRTLTLEGQVIGATEIDGSGNVILSATVTRVDGSTAVIKHKVTDIADAVPSTSDIEEGELFFNTTDAKVFFKAGEVSAIYELLKVGDTVAVSEGGTGVQTLTGYVKADGTDPFTASVTIPEADISEDGLIPRLGNNEAVTGIWKFSPHELSLADQEYLSIGPTSTVAGNFSLTISENVLEDESHTYILDVSDSEGNPSNLSITSDSLFHNTAVVWTSAHNGHDGGIDADLLDGQHGSYYTDASNISAGYLPNARLSGSYTGIESIKLSNINGDKLSIKGDLGVESSYTLGTLASELYYRSPYYHRWYVGTFADTSNYILELSISGIIAKAPMVLQNTMTVTGALTADTIVAQSFTVENFTSNVNNVTDLAVQNKIMYLNETTTPTDVNADGGGFILKGTTNKTILWSDALDHWSYNQSINLASGLAYRINGADVLKAGILGTSITASSLTSVGTLTSLTVAAGSGSEIVVGTDKVWHAGNDGAASGLDADLLDGQHGSYYLDFANITSKPTTLSGYGISDAQVSSSLLTAIAAVTAAADKVMYFTSASAVSTFSMSSFSRTTVASASASEWRTALGLVIGTNIQAYDADLAAIGAISNTSGLLRKTAANTWSLDTTNYLSMASYPSGYLKGLNNSSYVVVSSTTIPEADISADGVLARVSGTHTINGAWTFSSLSSSSNFAMTAAAGSWVAWSGGLAAPAFTTRSLGTKLALHNTISASQLDYAIGVNTNQFWHTMPSASKYLWYSCNGTDSNLITSMELSSDGNLALAGTLTSTSVNKVAITAPATSATLTLAQGSTLATSGAYSITLTSTAATNVTLPTTGTLATTGNLSQFAATTSAQLAGVISDETGSGSLVFATSPTLVTPVLGVATATSVNKVAITAPATSATLTIANGKTFTCSNTLTLTGTDSSSVAFGAGGTVLYASNKLSALSATTSSELAGVISDETGSGKLVFGTSPTISASLVTDSTSFDLLNTTATTVNFAGNASVLNIGKTTGNSTITIGPLTPGSGTTFIYHLGGVSNTSGTKHVYIGAGSAGTSTTIVDIGTSTGISDINLFGNINAQGLVSAQYGLAVSDTIGGNTSSMTMFPGTVTSLSVGSTSTTIDLKGTTASSSSSTGSLIVRGGVGIAGSLNVGGSLGTLALSVTSAVSTYIPTLETVTLSTNNSYGHKISTTVNADAANVAGLQINHTLSPDIDLAASRLMFGCYTSVYNEEDGVDSLATQYAITNMVGSGSNGDVTYTVTCVGHPFVAGDVVSIRNVTPTQLCGAVLIQTATTDSFTFKAAYINAYTSGGVAVKSRGYGVNPVGCFNRSFANYNASASISHICNLSRGAVNTSYSYGYSHVVEANGSENSVDLTASSVSVGTATGSKNRLLLDTGANKGTYISSGILTHNYCGISGRVHINSLHGVYNEVLKVGTTDGDALSAYIGTAYGVRNEFSSDSTKGTYGTIYGFYNNFTGAGISEPVKWGIYSAGADYNFLSGKLRIGDSTTPTQVLEVVGTVSATGYSATIQAPAYSATITPNLSSGNIVEVGVLTGNVTIGAFTNPVVGTRVLVILTQDSTGNRTVTWNSAFKFGATVTSAVSTAANKTDIFEFYISSSTVFRCISKNLGL